jgi:hypothetical protein
MGVVEHVFEIASGLVRVHPEQQRNFLIHFDRSRPNLI